ncbi:MAG: LytTR family DNA-binding domain-containing protein [Sphingomonas bacterium]
MTTSMGTSGGGDGMSGAQRRLALALCAGFVLTLAAVMLADVESTLSDFAVAGIQETRTHVWLWESTSILAWLTTAPVIWWLVKHVGPPRVSWPVAVGLILLASVPLSLWHVGLMVGLRKLYYAAEGSHYQFFSKASDRLLYEYRKDLASYLQFLGFAAVSRWLVTRAATPQRAPEPSPVLTVADGAVTHQVPVDQIAHVTAAGNYVEIAWAPRTLLHRATLAGVAQELGAGFVQIHRSRLVRRAAIRRIETDRSGDFTVVLEDGTELKGSRRYRESVQG